uniref:Nuclear pore complex NUP2/50/61 domain-containing protein n=1 Tax=Microcebus murinus TaxID=30608 RepID=A0A8C5Y8H7_MICMU
MAKRTDEKELTDWNWDQKDEAEEVGTFSGASEEVLKNRAIKKAKRRNVGFESDGGGAFKGLVVPSGGGFSGFGSSTGGNPLEGLTAITPPFTSARVATETKAAFSSIAANGPTTLVDKKISNPKTNGDSQQPSSSAYASNTYNKQLAALNCSVQDWIVKHVNANHSQTLNSNTETERWLKQSPSLCGSTKLQQESSFLFSGNKTEDTSEKKTEVVSEKKMDPSLGATSASFNFGKKIDSSVLDSLSSGPIAGFSFSSGNSSLFSKDTTQSKPVSSPLSTKTLESQAEGGSNECKGGVEEENEEPPKEPPKVVVTEVKEEDAFYSKKYKLFYKKDNEFKEKGVGTLHLKPAANQKIAFGMGKNNILIIVCVPNPPVDEKNATTPVTMLIWVKTSKDADELHKILLEEKKDA